MGLDGRAVMINRKKAFECKSDFCVSIQGAVVVSYEGGNTYYYSLNAGIF
jgi:hypothetical protein